MSRWSGSLLLAGALAACVAPGPTPVAEPVAEPVAAGGAPGQLIAPVLPPRAVVPPPRGEPRRLDLPPPPAEQDLRATRAATPAGARIVALLVELRDGVRETRYQHTTQVRRRAGFYAWDCSGMASWILGRTSGRALRALRRQRAVAADFFEVIDRAPVGEHRRGWEKLGHVSEARPGDLFAFRRSPLSSSPVTGHVGFVVEQPREVPGWPGMYVARIADSTSYPHQRDTRGDDTTGFGFGTMLFATDDSGETIAYGWYGTQSRGLMPTKVVFGRVW